MHCIMNCYGTGERMQEARMFEQWSLIEMHCVLARSQLINIHPFSCTQRLRSTRDKMCWCYEKPVALSSYYQSSHFSSENVQDFFFVLSPSLVIQSLNVLLNDYLRTPTRHRKVLWWLIIIILHISLRLAFNVTTKFIINFRPEWCDSSSLSLSLWLKCV